MARSFRVRRRGGGSHVRGGDALRGRLRDGSGIVGLIQAATDRAGGIVAAVEVRLSGSAMVAHLRGSASASPGSLATHDADLKGRAT